MSGNAHYNINTVMVNYDNVSARFSWLTAQVIKQKNGSIWQSFSKTSHSQSGKVCEGAFPVLWWRQQLAMTSRPWRCRRDHLELTASQSWSAAREGVRWSLSLSVDAYDIRKTLPGLVKLLSFYIFHHWELTQFKWKLKIIRDYWKYYLPSSLKLLWQESTLYVL